LLAQSSAAISAVLGHACPAIRAVHLSKCVAIRAARMDRLACPAIRAAQRSKCVAIYAARLDRFAKMGSASRHPSVLALVARPHASIIAVATALRRPKGCPAYNRSVLL